MDLDFLAEGDEARAWLAQVKGSITVLPPKPIDPRVPPSLRRILERCSGLYVGEPGTAFGVELHDGFSGALHALGRDSGLKKKRDGFDYDPSICAPIDDGLSRFYLFHPVTGELRLFDQDGGLQEGDQGDPGAVFLRLAVELQAED